ncbi:MAG TPA: permease prefix domain 1-containing protein, partial [Thermoanaerobaculia bacterium]
MSALDLFGRARRERELAQEIASHLAFAVEERVARGESRAAAESAAKRELGNVSLIQDATREVWGWRWLERLLADLAFGVRLVRRNPQSSAIAVLTLALGIGAATAIWSVVDGVLLRPLPFPHADRIVQLWELDAQGGTMRFSDPNFEDVRASGR